MSSNGSVSFSIDGREVRAEKGRLLIDVAEEMGIFVPRFCYHPGMRSVAVCRMCLVKVEGQKKLLPACATPVDQDMKVTTVDPEAVDAQEGMLEFLLINHPLDCPICDRGGECPLQDQTYRHGPGSSRYVEPKRTYEKALEISELVVLDRERCVLCWRCVRFADEIAGDRFIQLVDRGAGTQILTFKDDPFDSYFSGNTIQICPVGALTSKPYRFVSRPWDLQTSPSVCGYCSVGCPITNESRAGNLVRCQALPNENVNDFWICDKGRFGYHYVNHEERLEAPLKREGDEFAAVSWGDALAAIKEKLDGAQNIGVLAGGHLTTEDAYAIARLGRNVLKTKNLDSRIHDAGAPYEAVLSLGAAGSTATLNDLESATTIVWCGPDPKETLPVLFLRLRKAVLDMGAKLTVVSPRRISLDVFATKIVRATPTSLPEELGKLSDLGESPVVCWGPSFAGEAEDAIARAAVALAQSSGAGFLMCPPHAGSQGLIDMGVHPALDAGHEPIEEPGLDTRGILEAAANGELDALIVFGADPISDFPDAALAAKALSGKTFTVVMELFPTETAMRADVVLPSAAYAEHDGTFTNLERRLQKLEALLPPPGSAIEVWRACARIASTLGTDWSWHRIEDVWSDLMKSVPTHAQIDLEALTQHSPPTDLQYESGFESHMTPASVAGPGGPYPKGHRSGAPFQTGQNWPLSWELRAFEARQRPGLIPALNGNNGDKGGGTASGEEGGGAASGAQPYVANQVSAPKESPPKDAPRQARGGAEDAAPQPPQPGTQAVLLTGRLIYDEGTMVSKSAALRGIARSGFAELGEQDAATLGVTDGDRVVIAGAGHEVELEVSIGDVAAGCVFVPYDQQDVRANRLIDGTDLVVEVRKA